MAHSLLLITVACRWFGKAPFVKNCTAWALTCPKTVQQKPWLTREIETRLPDSRVSYSGVIDHSSRLPVLSPLRSCVNMSDQIGVSGGKMRRRTFKHISTHRPVWMGFNDVKHLFACCFAAKWRWSYIREYRKRRDWSGMLAAWNQSHGTVKLGIYLRDWCSWILCKLGNSILQLSSKEPELMCGGCLHRHLQVSWSGYYST